MINRQHYRFRLNLGWIRKTEASVWEKRGLRYQPVTVGPFRLTTLSPGDSVSIRPSFDPRNLRKNSVSCHSLASGEGCQLSPFDIVGELLMRRSHISLSDLHRFHKHPTQRFQILDRHLKNVSLSPLFDCFSCCLIVPLIQIRRISFFFLPLRLPLSCHLFLHE